MKVDMLAQIWVTVGAFLIGVTAGMFWELARICRHFFRHGAVDFVLDSLAMVTMAVVSVWYFQTMADGQIRWYDIALEAVGAFVYRYALGRFLFGPVCKILEILADFIRRILDALMRPIYKLFGLLLGPLKFLCVFLKKSFIFVKKYIIIFLYNLLPRRRNIKERTKPNGSEKSEEDFKPCSEFYH